MAIETELKFLVSPAVADALPAIVNRFADDTASTNKAHLANTYYDTQTRLFRQADIGFRTRSTDGVWEQTIKTAGQVTGGLHQRPEYNVAIESNRPDLSLFDPTILPPDTSVSELQSSLIALFTTDFNRQTWLVKKADSELEVVFDQGFIQSSVDGSDQQLEICEVELELVKGDVGVLFAFAADMVEQLSTTLSPTLSPTLSNTLADNDQGPLIRLGAQSKAARGYQLLSGRTLQPKNQLGHAILVGQETLDSSFAKALEYGLQFMQYHEQCFVDNPSLLALRRFTDGVAMIRHAFWLFSAVISETTSTFFRAELKWILQSFQWVEHSRQLQALKSKTGMYRKKLDLNKSLLQLVDEEADKDPDATDINAFFASPRYNLFLLNISLWMLNKGWRDEGKTLVTSPLRAEQLLNDSWQSLLQVMPKRHNLSMADYISHHQQLKRSLLTGACVSSQYEGEVRQDFRMPWIDLSQGIDELKTLDLLQSLAARLDESTEGLQSINSWLEQQVDSLLLAMEQSRKSAVRMRPYWV